MRRLVAPVLALLSAGVLAAATAAAAAPAGGLRVFEAKGPAFPVRSFVLSLPASKELTANDVSVTENGQSVTDLTLVPASQASKKTFGVVLVLDASDSMKGVPIEQAVAAERAFAARRNPNQQLGLVAFNSTARVVLPLTASGAKIAAALAAAPRTAFGTHIFDALATAEQMLVHSRVTSGSVVLLSDGADTGSRHSAEQVARAARADHLRVFTVGLQSSAFKPHTLEALAAAGNGSFAIARTTRDLNPLFDQLGQLLSNEYLLQYKSLVGPDLPVRVQVQVTGLGSGATDYRTPALPVKAAPPPYNPSLGNRVWSSPITMIVLALLGAAVVALLVIGVAQPRRSTLPARMAEFVSVPGLQQDRVRPGGPSREAGGARRKSLWERFGEVLEIADIKASRQAIVGGTVVVTVLTFALIWLGTGSPLWALFAFALPFGTREWVARTLSRRRYRFAEQLPDALQVIASALRAGHSFAGALAVVVESASEPMKSEMQRVVADEQLGIPLQDSLVVVGKRMASRDVEQVALVAELQREAGGNAAEVVDRVAETVRERFDLRRLIQTLTMQGRMSRWIVSALPVAIVLILQIENPHYLHPLLQSTGGKVVFGLAAAWALAGSYVIKKIVEIEV